MRYENLSKYLADEKVLAPKKPVAILLAEDETEIASTLVHNGKLGFERTIALMPDTFDLPEDLDIPVDYVTCDTRQPDMLQTSVNEIIAAMPAGTWMYFSYNAEYLFYPFCETRTIGELLAFHTEERRDAMLTYVVDLYSNNLSRDPNAVSTEHAFMDRTGYYALARPDPVTTYPKERQLDFFGGLRWRFEEHVPVKRRKIDRISLFKTKPGLALREDHTFNDEEYNTYACEWHHNITAAVCSFRTAKALKLNPGSTHDIPSFMWHNSTQFEWHSDQLMNLGLMEPGQWF